MATLSSQNIPLSTARQRYYRVGVDGNVPVEVPAFTLVDADGNPLTTIPVSLSGTTPVSIAGEVEVTNDAGNPLSVTVSNFPATQPVSIAGTVKSTDRDFPIVGVYHANAVQTTVTQAADGATAGRFWLINPVGSARTLRVRRLSFLSISTTTLITLTVPNFTIARITFTGTSSAGLVVPCKADSAYPDATGLLVNAISGITPVVGAVAKSFQTHMVLTGVGAQQPTEQLFPAETNLDEFITLRAGEGIVCRQATAGTLLDTRSVRVDITWEEI